MRLLLHGRLSLILLSGTLYEVREVSSGSNITHYAKSRIVYLKIQLKSSSAALKPTYSPLSSGNVLRMAFTTHAGITRRFFFPNTPWAHQVN